MGAKMKTTSSPFSQIRNQRGLATLEAAATLIVFVVMIAYTTGTFGIVHTGILHSINARAYVFETVRNRANVTYFRDQPRDGSLQVGSLYQFSAIGFRAHGISTEKDNPSDHWIASTRPMAKGLPEIESERENDTNQDLHLNKLRTAGPRRESRRINPVWIKSVYGICLNSSCTGVKR